MGIKKLGEGAATGIQGMVDASACWSLHNHMSQSHMTMLETKLAETQPLAQLATLLRSPRKTCHHEVGADSLGELNVAITLRGMSRGNPAHGSMAVIDGTQYPMSSFFKGLYQGIRNSTTLMTSTTSHTSDDGSMPTTLWISLIISSTELVESSRSTISVILEISPNRMTQRPNKSCSDGRIDFQHRLLLFLAST